MKRMGAFHVLLLFRGRKKLLCMLSRGENTHQSMSSFLLNICYVVYVELGFPIVESLSAFRPSVPLS